MYRLHSVFRWLSYLTLRERSPLHPVPIVNSVRAENVKVTGACCEELRGSTHRSSGRHFSSDEVVAEPQSVRWLKGTVDNFVAVQSTLEQSVSTCFNNQSHKSLRVK